MHRRRPGLSMRRALDAEQGGGWRWAHKAGGGGIVWWCWWCGCALKHCSRSYVWCTHTREEGGGALAYFKGVGEWRVCEHLTKWLVIGLCKCAFGGERQRNHSVILAEQFSLVACMYEHRCTAVLFGGYGGEFAGGRQQLL